MLLSEVLRNGFSIIRDGEFEALGLSNTEGNKLLSFLEDEKFLTETKENPAISCLLITEELYEKLGEKNVGIAIVSNPRETFFRIHNALCTSREYVREDFKTRIGEKCNISPLSYIEPNNVVIGNNVTIEEFVGIRGHCVIGDNCIIHSGAQIGGSGYEFKLLSDSVLDIVHAGGVVIGRDTIIWSNTTIHKAVYPWDNTIIGESVRINSNAHIDHGAKIGDYSRVCAGAVISGRVETMERVNVGPGAVISNRISIGENAKVALGAVVTSNVCDNEKVTGNFAIEHSLFMQNLKKLCREN